VDELRRKLGKEQQVSIWCQLVEVDLTKLENAAVEWSKLGPISGAPSPFLSLSPEGGPQLPEFVDALRKKNIAKLIADPTIVTMSGRPASFRQGGEIAAPAEKEGGVKFKQLGTQMDFVAIAQGAKRIRLELRVKSSELDPETTMTVNGERLPGVNVREFDTGLEVTDGEVSVLSWPEQIVNEVTTDEATGAKTESTRKLKTFCLVRVDLMDPAAIKRPDANAPQAEAATTRRK
jgi:Flp pilus assembly secretin CpaC